MRNLICAFISITNTFLLLLQMILCGHPVTKPEIIQKIITAMAMAVDASSSPILWLYLRTFLANHFHKRRP